MDTQILTDQLFWKALTAFPPLQGTQVTGRKADVIKAAHLCAEAALRLVKPGNQNTQVTEAWNKVAHSFNCTPIEGETSDSGVEGLSMSGLAELRLLFP